MSKYAPFTSSAALKRAKSYVGKRAYSNMCQAFVVTMFGTGSVGDFDGDGAADAQDGWKKAKANGKVVLAKDIKSYSDIPAGVPLFWEGGSHGYGHTAISAGGGKIISTDAGKAWGYVGVVDLGYISRVWRNGLTFRGYALVEGNGHTLTDPPTTPTPKPPATTAFCRVGTYNLAMYNKRGQSTFDKRKGRVAANVAKAELDVLCVQEAGSGAVLAHWDSAFGKLGLVRSKGGSDGRYIYFRKSVFSEVAAGTFDLKPEYQKDDKQAAWSVLRYGGADWLFTSFHLEEANGKAADDVRPLQASSLTSQAASIAARHGIIDTRAIHCGDTNSLTLVAAEMTKHGFVDSSKNALKVLHRAYATFNNWVRKTLGGHIDYVFVDAKRPVCEWDQVASQASDHNLVVVTIGKA